MAARSTGIFLREGFNLDNAFEVTSTPTDAPVTLKHVRTFRVIAVGFEETAPTGDYTAPELSYSIGGKTYNVTAADLDHNGVYIAHHRGHSLDTNEVSYAISGSTGTTGDPGVLTIGGMFIELVDGVAR